MTILISIGVTLVVIGLYEGWIALRKRRVADMCVSMANASIRRSPYSKQEPFTVYFEAEDSMTAVDMQPITNKPFTHKDLKALKRQVASHLGVPVREVRIVTEARYNELRIDKEE